MSAHQRHARNVNSLLAYHEGETALFEKRELEILGVLRNRPNLSDREIMIALEYGEPNQVRPRITELLKDGVLEQTGNRIDPLSGKRVRIVSLRRDPRKPQAEFIFRLEAAS